MGTKKGAIIMKRLEQEELEAYRTKEGNGQIEAYYMLVEELGVGPGGSLIEAVQSLKKERNYYRDALEDIINRSSELGHWGIAQLAKYYLDGVDLRSIPPDLDTIIPETWKPSK